MTTTLLAQTADTAANYHPRSLSDDHDDSPICVHGRPLARRRPRAPVTATGDPAVERSLNNTNTEKGSYILGGGNDGDHQESTTVQRHSSNVGRLSRGVGVTAPRTAESSVTYLTALYRDFEQLDALTTDGDSSAIGNIDITTVPASTCKYM